MQLRRVSLKTRVTQQLQEIVDLVKIAHRAGSKRSPAFSRLAPDLSDAGTHIPR
jgi:hypothetical protein